MVQPGESLFGLLRRLPNMDALIVAATPESLNSIRKYVTTAAAAADLEKKAASQLCRVVDEIAMSAIVHGHAGADDKDVWRVQAHIEQKSLTIILEDQGEPYDPYQSLSLPASDAALEDSLDHPLQGVDEFRYQRVGDWNRHIFVMNRAVITAETRSQSEKLADDLIRVILPIGIALSAEKDFDRLLESILIQAKSVCNADGGTLYLPEDNRLKATIMRNDSLNITMGGPTREKVPYLTVPLYEETTGEPNRHNIASYVALCAHSVNIPDIAQAKDFDFSGTRLFDQINNYRSISTFTTPLKNHEGEVIGVLQLLNAQDFHTGRVIPFDSYMQQLVEALASQAAVVLNNRMLLERQKQLLIYEHDLEIGEQIQANFLPSELPQPYGWEIAAGFRPARKVAGDFYDAFYVEAQTKVCLIIADVCDKGVGAALFMALSRSLIRAFAGLHESLATGGKNPVELTNEYIVQNHGNSNMFVTLFYGVLDLASGQLAYVNCGHNPPVIIGSTGVKLRLRPTVPAVGVFPNIEFKMQQVGLESGDVLFAFTDGVTDARASDNGFFTEERLLQLLQQPAPSALALLNRIDESLRSHIGVATQFDDITMIAARRQPVLEVKPE
jgi:sigma-B regulation protein RsbU (phosphoserine phosphatase)